MATGEILSVGRPLGHNLKKLTYNNCMSVIVCLSYSASGLLKYIRKYKFAPQA